MNFDSSVCKRLRPAVLKRFLMVGARWLIRTRTSLLQKNDVEQLNFLKTKRYTYVFAVHKSGSPCLTAWWKSGTQSLDPGTPGSSGTPKTPSNLQEPLWPSEPPGTPRISLGPPIFLRMCCVKGFLRNNNFIIFKKIQFL